MPWKNCALDERAACILYFNHNQLRGKKQRAPGASTACVAQTVPMP